MLAWAHSPESDNIVMALKPAYTFFTVRVAVLLAGCAGSGRLAAGRPTSTPQHHVAHRVAVAARALVSGATWAAQLPGTASFSQREAEITETVNLTSPDQFPPGAWSAALNVGQW
jgi:hypothetical protein